MGDLLNRGSVRPADEVLYEPDRLVACRLTLDEAAAELGLDRSAVEEMVIDGSLPSEFVRGEYLVNEEDLRDFQDRNTAGVIAGSHEAIEPWDVGPGRGDLSRALR